MGEQSKNLERVKERIGECILDFCTFRVGQTFHMEELQKYVAANVGKCAPDSPSRVLRQLRLDGRVTYRVVSRSASSYIIDSVSR